MVGYSRLIGLDDAGTLQRLRALRTNLIDPAIDEHGGRIVQTGGDSLLIVFDSIDGAVRCAVEVQERVPIHDGERPADRAIRFRVGINIGDATDMHGDAVNVAARLQAECPPGSVCVSRSVRDHVHGRLDLTFEERGSLNLKNIARPVEAFVLRVAATAGTFHSVERSLVHGASEALPLPEKPSIAVLPFTNLSGDPEQEYFADGMTEEIITALSRIRWLFVIARNSSFTYKGKTIDIKQVGRELGIRYIMEGSVRKEGQKVRIGGQLIDSLTGAHLWADRFDGSLEGIFELQDNVATAIAGIVEPTLQRAEARRSADRPTNDLTAYDLYLRAVSLVGNNIAYREGWVSALELLGRAIERDPHYGVALANAANCHLHLHVSRWSADLDRNKDEGINLARRALQVTRDDPSVLGLCGHVLAYFGEDIDAAIKLIDHALTLNPSFANGWLWSGWVRAWAGQPELAINHFETALRLSPHTRTRVFFGIGVSYLLLQRFAEAAAMLVRTLQEEPSLPPPYRFLAACYAHMGRLDDAQNIIKRLRAISPVIVQDIPHYRSPAHRELYLSGLRLAAGEAK
jgi:adenylate cyclase